MQVVSLLSPFLLPLLFVRLDRAGHAPEEPVLALRPLRLSRVHHAATALHGGSDLWSDKISSVVCVSCVYRHAGAFAEISAARLLSEGAAKCFFSSIPRLLLVHLPPK
jgi:hypothetical protein